mmetsp:Transcript_50/g.85  ORF Transcript_50/g.85 Transcript_50/m.85 type:complete len:316 (+) Transcript_50:249-1196(+)|eukprot:CAMPEP_0204831264 /NCGR_PEP_ID=MMETSP1346-20131115/10265_1 /ASSEMBLY_ACC=CAM_ASM_000771 /TAXON_ID=215587 /ORGANISM="Aplanochytrium stocchinoi, Strain GSBS06" /LENGTH=315 /DNA_ID=CAMNT_0051962165 /DNA_START=177 /DNA_END=1124 /DNA_ORIENTATION=-
MYSTLEICGVLFVISLLTYLVPMVWLKFRGVQDLKKKYPGAEWALVTGGSSGIGRAIVEKLAKQGFNVVVVAYPDKFLDSSVEEYKIAYPHLQFRKIPANLADPSFMPDLIDKTKDITISCLFNNAGYIKTGFYAETPVEAQMANHNCNATSVLQITHHYVRLMQTKQIKGCVTFTSSPAGFMPCPFSVMYGATKSYLTLFAMSLAPEIRSDGIDVCVVHPSPVASRFYEKTHALDALVFFKSTATGPESIANALFATIGRSVVRDQGYYPPMVKILLKIIDVNLLADIISMTASSLGDFKAMKAKSAEEKLKAK